MSWRKKWVTVSSGGTEQLIPPENVNTSISKAKRDAVKKYIFDTSGLPPLSHDIQLSSYLIAAKSSGMYHAWEKAYKFAAVGKYHPIGAAYLVESTYQGGYYPMIPLRFKIENGSIIDLAYIGEYHNYYPHRKAAEEVCKLLGLSLQELTDELKKSIGGDWGRMQYLGMHLAVTLPNDGYVEYPDALGSLAYLFEFASYKQDIEGYGRPMNLSFGNYGGVRYVCDISDNITLYRSILDLGSFISEYDIKYRGGSVFFNVSNYPENIKQMPIGSYGVMSHRYYYNDRLGEIKTTTICILKRVAMQGTPDDYERRYSTVENYNGRHGRPEDSFHGYQAMSWVSHKVYGTRTTESMHPEGLLVPIDRTFLNRFTAEEKERIIQESLRISYEYQTSQKVYKDWVGKVLEIGKILLQVAAVNLTFGAGSFSTAALGKLVLATGLTLGVNKLIDFAVKVGIISPKVANIIKLVVQLRMIAKGAGWDFSKVLTAPNLMKAVNLSFDYYNKKKAWEMQEVQKQQDEHNRMHQSRMEALAAKQKMADLGVASDPSLYLDMPSFAPSVNLFEPPEMMYARHYNFNVVNLSHGVISNLADGLKYRQVNRVQQVRDITQEIEDVLLIT